MKILVVLGVLLAATLPRPAAAQAHAAVLTDADAASLRQIEAYLNGLHTLKGRFLQVGPDGKTSTGTVWLDRPGRMRFAYDPPSPLLLVAGNGQVVFHDAKLDQTTTIAVGQTPLGLLLRDRDALTGDVTVTAFQNLPGQIQVSAVKTASPGDGTLTLVLNARPLALVGWTVVDAEGRETRIRLSDVTLGGNFPQSLFTYTDPALSGEDGNTP